MVNWNFYWWPRLRFFYIQSESMKKLQGKYLFKVMDRQQILLLMLKFRNSHWTCSVRKGVLRNFAKFTEKHLCEGLIFNKVAGLRRATFLTKRLWHRCFHVNFLRFLLRTPFLQNTSRRTSAKKIFFVIV